MPELRLPVRRGRRRVVLWLLVSLGVLIVFISPIVGLLAEWPWFSALGYGRAGAIRLAASRRPPVNDATTQAANTPSRPPTLRHAHPPRRARESPPANS